MIHNNSQPETRDQRRKGGFTLIEALAGIAMIAIVAGSVVSVLPLNIKLVERGTSEVEISMAAKSIKDAIITGAKENYEINQNRFSFVYEGVAVSVELPQIGTETVHPELALGLYPSGLLYTGQVMQVYRVGSGTVGSLPELRDIDDENDNPFRNSFIGPSFDEDINILDGTITTSAEDINRNGFIDTFEDVGLDGFRDELERDGTGFDYDAVNNPDPANDNFDPIRNPFGTERNGKRDDPGELDLNSNGYLDVPDLMFNLKPSTYLHDQSYRNTYYGYTLKVIHPMVIDPDNSRRNNTFTFELAIYKGFFRVRPALQSARQEILDAAARPELDGHVISFDDDRDGVDDDTIVTDAEGKINGMPAAIPETVLDGIDDDNDGKVDDGLVKPDFVERFQIIF